MTNDNYLSSLTANTTTADETIECELPSVKILAHENTTITSSRTSPRGPIYPVGLSIDPEIARHLTVWDIKIGANSQIYSTGNLPGTLFERSADPMLLHLDPLLPNMRITLGVLNTSDEEITFRGQVLVRRQPPPKNESLKVVLPFVSTIITPESVALLTSCPQLPMAPDFCLYVPPDMLQCFEVSSLSTERYLDDVSPHGVPASQLSAESLIRDGRVDLTRGLPILQHTQVELTVKNLTKIPQTFRAALLGSPVLTSGNENK
ncbi:MAG TPA: hypothetical protein VMS77_09480 [Conexivisphaerales archaeon]|nr:hypothetical protein [Conexivisphaerales archaeon]